MTHISSTTLDVLQSIVGEERVSITAAIRQQHAQDQSDHPAHLPDVVIWPRNTAEISSLLQFANEQKIPVTAWGAGTSIEGNPIPIQGGIVLDMGQMNQIVHIHDTDFQVTVQPGVLYKDMNEQLARYGLFFAPDPGANASIGGMLANNAAGIRTVKYGATRDNVLALEVVLANGEIIRTGSRSVKQSAGYDLTHLFVGSEGTLGIITEATLMLAPLPEHFSAATVAFSNVSAAAETVFEIIGSGLEPTALELIGELSVSALNTEPEINLKPGPNLFMEFSGASEIGLRETMDMVAEICQANGCLDYQAGIGRDARAQLWQARHRLFEIMLRVYPGQAYLVTDIAVPISHYPELVTKTAALLVQHQLKGPLVGHAGDGNLHATIFFPPDDQNSRALVQQIHDEMVQLALSLNGTSTGEHGVGLGKQKYMLAEHGQPALNVMRRLKATLDPNGILNPGKVLAL